MALSPVSKESPHYEAVLHVSASLSTASSYSGESFESCTEESSRRCKCGTSITDEHSEKYLSDSFESFEGESSHQQRSDSFSSITQDSSRNYGSDSFESLSTELDKTYSSDNSYIEFSSVEDDHKENDQVVPKEPSRSETKALQSYCSLKIQHLLQTPKRHKQKKGQPLMHPSQAIPSISQPCPVPHGLMNRLKLQHIKETVNQVIKTEMHDPAACPDCCNKQAELAQCQFIRIKKTKLEADLLQRKLEEYICSKDLVTCIGEILQSLPKPSEQQNAIWQRLHRVMET